MWSLLTSPFLEISFLSLTAHSHILYPDKSHLTLEYFQDPSVAIFYIRSEETEGGNSNLASTRSLQAGL